MTIAVIATTIPKNINIEKPLIPVEMSGYTINPNPAINSKTPIVFLLICFE
jgi:hypothetical protein